LLDSLLQERDNLVSPVMSNKACLKSTSSSNIFCWTISLEEWNKKAVGEFLSLRFVSNAPTGGKVIHWRLDIYPKGFKDLADGTRNIDLILGQLDLDVDPDYDLGPFQIETAYRIRHEDSYWPIDMFNSRSYYQFHSDVFKKSPSWEWLRDSYQVGTVEDRAVDGLLTFEFEMRTYSAPRMKCKYSGSKHEMMNKTILSLDPEDGDVKLICEGKQFSCHKFLLTSQSPVFGAMFEMDSLENKKNEVVIVDSIPEAVEEFVLYLYRGWLIRMYNDLDLMFELLNLANKYQMDFLMNECLDGLMDMMNVNNVLKIFAVVDKIGGSVTYLIIDFMKKNIKNIVDKEDWPAFTSDHPNLVKDFILNMNEELNEMKTKTNEQE